MSIKTQDFLQQAFSHHRNGQFAEAARLYRKVIKREPANHHALHSLGIIEASAGNLVEGARLMGRSVAAQPTNFDFVENYAVVLCQAGDFGKAVDAADAGLKLRPSVKLLSVRATSLLKLECYEQAIAAFDQLLASDPGNAPALAERAVALAEQQCHDDALSSIDAAIRLMPAFAVAYLNRGNIYRRLKRFQDAMASFEKALQLNRNLSAAWLGLGNTLMDLRLPDKAAEAYDRALTLDPDAPELEGLRIHAKAHACDWRHFTDDVKHLLNSVRAGKPASDPFTLLSLPATASDQMMCAKSWGKLKFPKVQPLWKGEAYAHDRIRVGYLSADFMEHATAQLIAGLFEHHDKSRFEITAIALNKDDRSAISRRMRDAFEHWLDAELMTDAQIAEYIHGREIDVLVDLNGFTRDARTGILARRPAPVQVNYLGYPGTMGADFIDYIIADPIVAPPADAADYSERIIRLPQTYQINDRKRAIDETVPTRAEAGLPEQGFVFCCFNNNYKIRPEFYDRWMQILKRVDGSVLWLLEANQAAAANLRQETAARGVDPARLVFARRTSAAKHLARHALAGLFLDTGPYNAHTTASDALWTGLPVITMRGETFAGRVAASLLNAAGAPELITTSLDEYEEAVVALAQSPERLAGLRDKLNVARDTCPLFDTAQLTKDIESAFASMMRT